MSTPATPAVPVTPVAPVAAADVNVNMTREQIASAIPEPAPVAPIPVAPVVVEPTADNPVAVTDLGNGQLSVKYLTGETFQGTAAELATKIGQAHVNTKNWAKSQQPAPVPVPEPAPVSLFATPEEEATAKYVTELQAKALGFSTVDDYKNALSRIQQNTDQFAGQNLSVQFAAVAPEFNATPENSEKLLNTVDSLGLAANLASNDPRMQLNALRAAHSYALLNKIYEPRPAANAIPVGPTPPPPPLPSSGPVDLSTIPEDLRVDQNMSKEEIMRRIDLARQRQIIY